MTVGENAASGHGGRFSGRTAWVRNLETPLRRFLRTETGGGAILLVAALAALAWVNVDAASYESVWSKDLAIRIGDASLSQDLRGWVNTGLMAFFFLIVGLEARREFDMGELRERRRFVVPLLAGVGGMLVPVAIYLAVNSGRGSAHGWGVVIATDTAFALGMLALLGSRFPDRLRSFMLTVVVIDDLVALGVIAIVYTDDVASGPLLIGLGILAAMLVARWLGLRNAVAYALLAVAAWVAFFESGVDPVVVGLAVGLFTVAHPAARTDLEQATDLFRRFREQPTPELARSARIGLASTISPNERLQERIHPWTSYLIVPLFALVNAGIAIDGDFLAQAFSSPITLGILLGSVVGKPVGIVGASWLLTRLSRGRLRPPVGWAAVIGAGTVAGIGFTLSLLIATHAFQGDELEEAKAGVLAAAVAASIVTWLVALATGLLPARLRLRALISTAQPIVDLAVPVDLERDRIRGPVDAPVTIVEYGDFECPYCGQAEPVVRELLAGFGDLRYVWRHLPLNDVHPRAQLAAEAAEAADRQGAFWAMHDLLLEHQDALRPNDLVGYAEQLGLDVEQFAEDLRRHTGAARVAEDVDSADLSEVSGTPTFFVNGLRHRDAYDIETLTKAVHDAKVLAFRLAPPVPYAVPR
jgi:Na+/H+ antiporter NhaA